MSIAATPVITLCGAPAGAQSSTPSPRGQVNASNEPVRSVLLDIGRRYHVNVVVCEGINGNVTVMLRDATLDDALHAVLTPLGYSYVHNGSVIIVCRPAVGASSTPVPGAAVIPLANIPAESAAVMLQKLYPRARVSVNQSANALIVVGSPEDESAMRAVASGIDVRNWMSPSAQAVQLQNTDPKKVADQLRPLFPSARFTGGQNRSLVIVARAADLAQIRTMVASMDAAIATSAPTAPAATALIVTHASPGDVARAIAREFPKVRAAVSGRSVVLNGPSDQVDQAKAIAAQIDLPAVNTKFTNVYRLQRVDAKSVADLIARSFPAAQVTADPDLNAFSVLATAADQDRIAAAVAQLDGPPAQPGVPTVSGAAGPATVEVIELAAGSPGEGSPQSTSAADIAAAVNTALQPTNPDLRVTVPANSTQLIVTGSPASIKLADQLIAKLDVIPPQVVLDTEVLEVDETAAKNLGLNFPDAILTATYSEIPPGAPPISGATAPPLLGIEPFTRTALVAKAQLNFLVQSGKARILADPRITTLSGRTASLHANNTITIITTIGGAAGTIPTTQLQNFQTGVSLDITPVVDRNGSISVTLHPVVNSLAGVLNGVPQIATRDATATVNLRDNQTFVIGGLIEDGTTRNETKTPLLGDLPLIGKLFRDEVVNYSRNEVVIVVTPHVLVPGENGASAYRGPPLPAIPSPQPLPTVPPDTRLPSPPPRDT